MGWSNTKSLRRFGSKVGSNSMALGKKAGHGMVIVGHELNSKILPTVEKTAGGIATTAGILEPAVAYAAPELLPELIALKFGARTVKKVAHGGLQIGKAFRR